MTVSDILLHFYPMFQSKHKRYGLFYDSDRSPHNNGLDSYIIADWDDRVKTVAIQRANGSFEMVPDESLTDELKEFLTVVPGLIQAAEQLLGTYCLVGKLTGRDFSSYLGDSHEEF